ncbi:heparinase II/III domain-containing protein [Chitinophaga lutea]
MRLLLLTISLLAVNVMARAQQHLLSGKFTEAQLRKTLIPQASWTPFPRIDDRAGWAKADPEAATAIIAKAEGFLEYEWPYIPATKSLLIVRNGNRSEYEAISFKKREVLGTLVLAEVFENKGRFTDQIVNGIWSICEESFWGVSAHLPKGKQIQGLVDVTAPFVDLFAAETATFLAWADYYLGAKFDSISPQIRKRIYYETNRRIFEPLMTKHHGWMGDPEGKGGRPNNWNPWICSNWLNAVLLLEKDEAKRTASVNYLLQVLDRFLDPYPADGGCDEGPGYWGAAAASLYDNIAMLNLATNNAFAYVYDDPKFRNMGQFIYKAQISPKYFLNFADADPQPGMAASMIYRYGKDIKDPEMMEFGAYYLDGQNKASVGRFQYFRNFYALFMYKEFNEAKKGLPMPADVWWPDLEVMVARDKKGSEEGFFVAAKGGHNAESHNHNDIGNYVVYHNGKPVLIDVGRGTYTAKTFSNKRYEIWYNRSDYHNVPDVNGKTQLPGGKYRATDVKYKTGKGFSQMDLNIAQSYPEDAGIVQWMRSIRLNRGRNVTIEDAMKLKQPEDYTQRLMTCYPAEVKTPGTIVIHAPEQDYFVHYPASQLQASVEKIPLTTMEDQGVKSKWGDNIHRISLAAVKPVAAEKLTFTVSTK